MALNWSGALQGGLGGAGAGALAGSVFPGIGNAVGAAGGGILGFLAGLYSGEPGALKQYETMSPEQKQALSQVLQSGLQNLQNPYQGFQGIENMARTNFQQNAIPGLANQFTSMGQGRSSNALSSPAFISQLGGAAAGLESNIAGLRSQYGLENQALGLKQLSLGLEPSFQNYYQQRQPGFGENFGGAVAQAAPGVYQSYLLSNALQSIK